MAAHTFVVPIQKYSPPAATVNGTAPAGRRGAAQSARLKLRINAFTCCGFMLRFCSGAGS